MSQSDVHASNQPGLAANALKGFSNATSYDENRPSYPPNAVENLLAALNVSGVKGARILDLAAGTGKFTELLANRSENYEIIAIEPHAEMRAQLERKLSINSWTNMKVEDGYADGMPNVGDEWADAVIVAQAFHWFANMKALKEIHRVLAPGAGLGLIWNVEDYNSARDWNVATDYEKQLNDLVWSLDDNDKRFRHMEWPRVFDAQLKSDPIGISLADPLFSLPLGEKSDPFEVWLTREEAWKRLHTISHIANLKGNELEHAKNAAMKIFWKAPENNEGKIAIHGRTYAVWTSAIPSETLKSGG